MSRFGDGSVLGVAGPTSCARRRNWMIWRYSLPVRYAWSPHVGDRDVVIGEGALADRSRVVARAAVELEEPPPGDAVILGLRAEGGEEDRPGLRPEGRNSGWSCVPRAWCSRRRWRRGTRPAPGRRRRSRDRADGPSCFSSEPPDDLADEAVVPQRGNPQLLVELDGELHHERRVEPVIDPQRVAVAIERAGGRSSCSAPAEVDAGSAGD